MLMYGKCECFVMQMLYVCVLCASSVVLFCPGKHFMYVWLYIYEASSSMRTTSKWRPFRSLIEKSKHPELHPSTTGSTPRPMRRLIVFYS